MSKRNNTLNLSPTKCLNSNLGILQRDLQLLLKLMLQGEVQRIRGLRILDSLLAPSFVCRWGFSRKPFCLRLLIRFPICTTCSSQSVETCFLRKCVHHDSVHHAQDGVFSLRGSRFNELAWIAKAPPVL